MEFLIKLFAWIVGGSLFIGLISFIIQIFMWIYDVIRGRDQGPGLPWL